MTAKEALLMADAPAFTAEDCGFLGKYDERPSWTTVPPSDREQFKSLRARMKEVARGVTEATDSFEILPYQSAQNVNGLTARDMWCCVYPAAASHASFAFQVALIVSGWGAEICFCLGAGTARVDSDRLSTLNQDWLERKRRLGALPQDLRQRLEDVFADADLRRKWREPPGSRDFETVDEWLDYAATPAGDGASISRNYTPDELEELGPTVGLVVGNLVRGVEPLLAYLYDGRTTTGPVTPWDWNWLVDVTNLAEDRLEELREAILGESKQVVLAGPPGTSKTWLAKALLRHVTEGDATRLRIVQFHPSYGYEDFVEGLRPTVDNHGRVSFARVPGEVLRFVEAIGESSDAHFLLMDEMNRANLSRVFGELMYLFEYRDEEIDLRFSKDFALPENVRFLGTMNTADRSIRSIDIALRRRFEVFECPPDSSVLGRFYAKAANNNALPTLLDGFEKLNDELAARLDRHHTIGHAFFMATNMTGARLSQIWVRKIGPLIEEYFFDQPDIAATFQPEAFWPETADAS